MKPLKALVAPDGPGGPILLGPLQLLKGLAVVGAPGRARVTLPTLQNPVAAGRPYLTLQNLVAAGGPYLTLQNLIAAGEPYSALGNPVAPRQRSKDARNYREIPSFFNVLGIPHGKQRALLIQLLLLL